MPDNTLSAQSPLQQNSARPPRLSDLKFPTHPRVPPFFMACFRFVHFPRNRRRSRVKSALSAATAATARLHEPPTDIISRSSSRQRWRRRCRVSNDTNDNNSGQRHRRPAGQQYVTVSGVLSGHERRPTAHRREHLGHHGVTEYLVSRELDEVRMLILTYVVEHKLHNNGIAMP